jgi:hypothetical protein
MNTKDNKLTEDEKNELSNVKREYALFQINNLRNKYFEMNGDGSESKSKKHKMKPIKKIKE